MALSCHDCTTTYPQRYGLSANCHPNAVRQLSYIRRNLRFDATSGSYHCRVGALTTKSEKKSRKTPPRRGLSFKKTQKGSIRVVSASPLLRIMLRFPRQIRSVFQAFSQKDGSIARRTNSNGEVESNWTRLFRTCTAMEGKGVYVYTGLGK